MPNITEVIYNRGFTITKSDTVNFTEAEGLLTDAVYVGGAGIVVAVWEDGKKANFTCVAGQLLPIRIKRVDSTTTTATLMVALYKV